LPQVRPNQRGEPDNQPPPYQFPADPKEDFDTRAQPIARDGAEDELKVTPEALLPHDEKHGRDHLPEKTSHLSILDRSMEGNQPA
jgi:hypothetical protein